MSEADQIARDNAKDALARIEAHERVCTERQLHIVSSLESLSRGVDKLNGRFWTAAITVILLLLSGCGALIAIILKGNG